MNKIKAFQFDIDGNLFHIETKMHVWVDRDGAGNRVKEEADSEQFKKYNLEGTVLDGRLHDPISSEAFKKGKLPHVIYDEDSFQDFSDDDIRSRDFQKALSTQSFGYVESEFRDALLGANEISLNTARGHSVQAITASIKEYILQTFDKIEKDHMYQAIMGRWRWDVHSGLNENSTFVDVLDTYFTKSFLVYPVTSPTFDQVVGWKKEDLPLDYIQRKPIAYQHYVDYLVEKYKTHPEHILAVGFSEDTEKNIVAVRAHIQDVLLQDAKYDHVYPVLYYTYSPTECIKTTLRTQNKIRKNFLNGKDKSMEV